MSEMNIANKPGAQSVTDAQASELDYVIAIDTSGSMAGRDPQRTDLTLFAHAQEWTTGLSRWAETVDDDGITVIPFGGSSINVTDNVTADRVEEVFNSQPPRGSTPTAEAVQKIIDMKLGGQLTKDVVAFIVTDGVPNNQEAVAQAIANWTNHPSATEHGISFSFIQIGDDAGARNFLQMLDDDLESKYGAKFDCVDTRTLAETESMSYGQLVWGAQND